MKGSYDQRAVGHEAVGHEARQSGILGFESTHGTQESAHKIENILDV
jgi:hypothetical protein